MESNNLFISEDRNQLPDLLTKNIFVNYQFVNVVGNPSIADKRTLPSVEKTKDTVKLFYSGHFL